MVLLRFNPAPNCAIAGFLQVAMAKPPAQTRDSTDPSRRLTGTLLGASRLGMGSLGMGLMRGRSRPVAARMMGYGADYGYGEMDHGYGAYAAAAAGGYQVSGMALVPMYLPNGQVMQLGPHPYKPCLERRQFKGVWAHSMLLHIFDTALVYIC